jgi:hypothetical protein
MRWWHHDAGRLRMLITLVFGLIHGFGFAADLLELQLPNRRRPMTMPA